MNAFEILLSRRFIVKDADRDLYYRMKDEVGGLKKFFTEKMGYQIIVNPYLIKLEKVPALPQSWMGITDFTEKIHYIFLCLILMFLEDKEGGEQFILSELLEYLQMNYQQEQIDWTLYQYRRHLVRVIKVCQEYHLMKVDDGSGESFMNDYEQEVLYENTGVSRYFMRNFTRDIQKFTSVADFFGSEWVDVDEDRGVVRRQRVYRKLLSAPGFYKQGEGDEDFAYLKNQRNLMKGELEGYIDCELDVHKTSAYLIIGEDSTLGRSFPAQSMRSDILLLCNGALLDAVAAGEMSPELDDSLYISELQLQRVIESCKMDYGELFSKTYRTMTSTQFYQMVKEEMLSWSVIEEAEDGQRILVRPVIGKLVGRYSGEVLERIKKKE
jgi:uncharacterized protein (TIGR02678 family)